MVFRVREPLIFLIRVAQDRRLYGNRDVDEQHQ